MLYKVNATDGKRKSILHHAVADGRLDIVWLLLDHNANVNAKDFKEIWHYIMQQQTEV